MTTGILPPLFFGEEGPLPLDVIHCTEIVFAFPIVLTPKGEVGETVNPAYTSVRPTRAGLIGTETVTVPEPTELRTPPRSGLWREAKSNQSGSSGNSRDPTGVPAVAVR